MEESNRFKIKMPVGLTPTSRRIIISSLGIMGVSAILGTAFGDLPIKDAQLIIVAITTGFFSIMKGNV